jgi:hypothetical protein
MGDQMTDIDSAREWLYFSQMDLNSAEYLLPMRPRYPKEITITDTQLQKAITDAKTVFEYVKGFFPTDTDKELTTKNAE